MPQQIFLAVIEDAYGSELIGISNEQGARELADNFEKSFLSKLGVDTSEIGIDIFRVYPATDEEIEGMLEMFLGSDMTLQDVKDKINQNGSIVLMDETDAARLSEAVMREILGS